MSYGYDSTFAPSFGGAWIAMLVSLCLSVVVIVGEWKMYEKAGQAGWKCLIPFYNIYVEFDFVYGNGWRWLLLLIPFANIYFAIKLCFDMAKVFGQSTAFGFGLLFLEPIFILIIGFSKDIQYEGSLDGKYGYAFNKHDDVTDEDIDALRQQAIEKLKKRKAERENGSFDA